MKNTLNSWSTFTFLFISISACYPAFSQVDSAVVIDHLSILNHDGELWFAEGIKLTDEPDFGGYQRIDLVTYSSEGDTLGDSRVTR